MIIINMFFFLNKYNIQNNVNLLKNVPEKKAKLKLMKNILNHYCR